MTDHDYISRTIDKLKAALAIHRSEDMKTVFDELKSKGISLAKTDDSYAVTVKWTDDAGNARSFVLEGYGHQEQTCLKEDVVNLDKNVSPEAKRAFAVFEKDQRLLLAISRFMESNDMVGVKKLLPELKPFMTLVENENKVAKERENAEWRKTYATCIELFGDEARG